MHYHPHFSNWSVKVKKGIPKKHTPVGCPPKGCVAAAAHAQKLSRKHCSRLPSPPAAETFRSDSLNAPSASGALAHDYWSAKRKRTGDSFGRHWRGASAAPRVRLEKLSRPSVYGACTDSPPDREPSAPQTPYTLGADTDTDLASTAAGFPQSMVFEKNRTEPSHIKPLTPPG